MRNITVYLSMEFKMCNLKITVQLKKPRKATFGKL